MSTPRTRKAGPVRTPKRTALLGLAVLVLVVGWLGVRGLLAQRHLTAARADLLAAKTFLLDRELDSAQRQIAAAGHETASARHLTSDLIWRAAAGVPVGGSTFAAAADIARGADDVARGALPPAFAAARFLDPRALRAPDGTIDVALLQRAKPEFMRAGAASTSALRRIRERPRRGVLPPVGSAAMGLERQAMQLQATFAGIDRALALAPALLGTDRPRRYFVLIQQTSESRGTGGLPGGFAVLTADRGRLKVTAQGSNRDLTNGPLPPPPGVPTDYVSRYAADGAFDLWVNVNLSPDLPVVAKVIRDRWKHQSGQSVDGVVAVDSQALADILRGSPPIAVKGAAPLKQSNIVDYLAVGQYRDFATPPGSSGGVDRSEARKQLLVTVAKAATSRLVGGGGSTLALLRGLADAVSSGHLRMASDDPKLQGDLQAAGVDGALPSGPAPVAYPVLFNSSGGKLDYFVDRSLSYSAGSCTGARRRSTISLTLTNHAPSGLPAYLTNPGNLPGIGNTNTDRLTTTIYATRGARLVAATLDDRPITAANGYLNGSSEDGLPSWSTLMDIPAGRSRRLVLTLDEPTARGKVRVPVQPLARSLSVAVKVPVC